MRKKSTSFVKEITMVVSILVALSALLRAQGQNTQLFDIVVAQDGSGDFLTITDAILAAPIFSSRRFNIRVKAGLYNENLLIHKKKTNLTLIGDGMDQTVIWSSKASETATVGVIADGFVAYGITFQNTVGIGTSKAVALQSDSSNSAYYRCRFNGFQDTLYARQGQQFFRECEVYGTVDFIFGDASVVFQNCKIFARKPLPGQSNTITAQGRDKVDGVGGFVFHNCTITGTPDLISSEYPVKTYLGRPWRDYSRTVIMQSFIDSVVDPKGWLQWDGKTRRLKTLYYAEYENRGPGALLYGRVKWKGYRVISEAEDAFQYTVRRFINGNDWIPMTGVPYDPDLGKSSYLDISLGVPNWVIDWSCLVLVLIFSISEV